MREEAGSGIDVGRSSRDKQRRYRARLRGRGLRPVQIWVPDTQAPGFAEECRRQAQAVSRSAGERETLELIEQIADWRL